MMHPRAHGARVQRAAVLLGLVCLLAGCVEGEPQFFEDKSAEVRSLHVNAYAAEEGGEAGREGRVEVSGIGPDGQERAFHGTVGLVLEEQDNSRPEHTYSFLKAWSVEVEAADFAHPDVPVYVHVVEARHLEAGKTFRVTANATIDGRLVTGPPALFYWSP